MTKTNKTAAEATCALRDVPFMGVIRVVHEAHELGLGLERMVREG
jgi:hypothetical protein